MDSFWSIYTCQNTHSFHSGHIRCDFRCYQCQVGRERKGQFFSFYNLSAVIYCLFHQFKLHQRFSAIKGYCHFISAVIPCILHSTFGHFPGHSFWRKIPVSFIMFIINTIPASHITLFCQLQDNLPQIIP